MCHLEEFVLIIIIKAVISHYTTQRDDHIKESVAEKQK
jgi:hypothetical protein